MLRSLLLISLLLGAGTVPPLATPKPVRTDTNHSTVGFSVPILGGISQVTGKFSRFELELNYDEEHPEDSTVMAKIDATSVDTGIDERDGHIRTDDFLNVEEYPEISYESFEVIPEGDRLTVIGVLTIRDVSQDVELDVQVLREKGGGASIGFYATATFDRQDFGVTYKHRDIPHFIGDQMTVSMHVLTRPAR
jgi:polyisoprenoid-binding protein YceI